MRHLYIKIYALIAMLTIFFVVGMFIFHIIDDTNKEIDNASITFNKFEKAIAQEVKNNSLEDEISRQRLKKLANALDIKGFVVQISPSVGKVFSYPSDSNLFTVVNGNVLIKEHSKFLKVFRDEVYNTVGDSQQKIYITVMMNVFPSKMLFVRSRTVFFFALALILLTGLIRILLSIRQTEKVEKVYTKFEEPQEKPKSSYGSYQATSPVASYQEPSYSHAYQETPPIAKSDLNGVFGASNEMPKQFSEIQSATPSYEAGESASSSFSDLSNSSSVSSPTSFNEEPKGLYSPITGFCWKDYLFDRLDSEIGRAASMDQDMSFVIIKIQNIDFSSINMESISNILIEAFLFKDMIFEYSDDVSLGFAGILQDVCIDDAIRLCDSLFSKLKNEIYLTGQEPTIGIGITTRSCRLANAKVFIGEAEGAVARALKNKNDPIVGFKPSAEKYRQQTIERQF